MKMKRKVSRHISIVLVIALLISSLSFSSSAKQPTAQQSQQSSTKDVSITLNGKDYDLGTIGGFLGALVAKKSDSQEIYYRTSVLEQLFTRLLYGINNLIPLQKSIQDESTYVSSNFYHGNDVFLSKQGTGWRLGYAQQSIKPDDFLKKDYYVAGNLEVPARKFNSVQDDIKVRTIALDDGTGRGISVFASVDVIGLSNKYVRMLRERMADFSEKQNIISLNVTSTHTHSSIDTMGIWGPVISTALTNWLSLRLTGKAVKSSVDETYMDFLLTKIEASVKDATLHMESGRLYQSSIGNQSANAIYNKINEKLGITDETEWNEELNARWMEEYRKVPIEQFGLNAYLEQRRNPYEYSPQMTKIRFVPDNAQSHETVMVNMAAHPYANGLNIGRDQEYGDALSGDYPYYMEQVVNESGANFIFFNGAINGVYPSRGAASSKSWYEDSDAYYDEYYNTPCAEQTKTIGRDFGSIALAMTMTQEEITANPLTNPEGRAWAYRETIARMGQQGAEETEIAPLLNIRLDEVKLEAQNPLTQIIGKLNIAQTDYLKDENDKLYAISEIGYMELGSDIKIALMPGEIIPGLVTGTGDTIGEDVLSGNDFGYPSLNELAGGEVTVFGLANDAIGYVISDNDYTLFYIGNPNNDGLSSKLFGYNYTHYQELFSLGKHTASTLITDFEKMLAKITRVVS